MIWQEKWKRLITTRKFGRWNHLLGTQSAPETSIVAFLVLEGLEIRNCVKTLSAMYQV